MILFSLFCQSINILDIFILFFNKKFAATTLLSKFARFWLPDLTLIICFLSKGSFTKPLDLEAI